jgi:hypothetical protein
VATINASCDLKAPAETVWGWLHDPAVRASVAAPLVHLQPIEPRAFPEEFVPAQYVVGMKLFGLVPLGRQAMNLHHPPPEPGEPLPRYVLHDQGSGDIAALWDHLATVEPEGRTACRVIDRLTVEAGAMTPFVALWAWLYLRLWHSRLRALAAERFG